MIINRFGLLQRSPIKGMLRSKKKEHGVSHGLSEAGYDIRIAEDVTFHPHYFGIGYPHYNLIMSNGDTVEEYGLFCLASAIEEFDMPNDLVGVVHDKSTWARQGLSVFNTVIEPGWKGFLTLELVYHGRGILHIPAGAGIAQVLFHQIAEPTSYDGKYQNQEAGPVQHKLEG
jgi:dCTP deaminase